MSATSVGATMAASATASHHGSTGKTTAAVRVLNSTVSGIPITSSRSDTGLRSRIRLRRNFAAWLNRITVSASCASTV